MGAMTPPSRKSCYNFRVVSVDKVLDGDTIDVTIDLGFDLYKKERVRIAGVDTPEKRTRDLEEKVLGIDATNWMKEHLEDTINGDDELIIRNSRRTQIEGNMTTRSDAINNALDDFWEVQNGSDGSTKSEGLL